MIEKVRVSLWDVFNFFMTGVVACVAAAIVVSCANPDGWGAIVSGVLRLPASFVLISSPILLALAGMLIEPVANYVDRYVFKYIFGWAAKLKPNASQEENVLGDLIRERYLGSLGSFLENPFHFCKDYVEYKQLSSTFMIFLSRYGFYRNCAFISLVTGILVACESDNFIEICCYLILSLLLVLIFRRRAAEFYSYQAPAVYRAFLIDRMDWNSAHKSD